MILEKHNYAKYAFLYLFSLVTLVAMAIGVGQVAFQAINKFIPDLLNNYSGSFDSGILKSGIALLIIAIPLYYVTMSYLERSLKKNDLSEDSAIRRWLIYFILFVSSVVMIVWFVMTIVSFLDGELTLKFILKSLTSIIIAGIIFSYYFYDIRRKKVEKKNLVIRIYFIATLIITIGTLVSSFFFVETPKEARARRHDEKILSQFTELDSAFNTYYTKYDKLPKDLTEALTESPYLNLDKYKDPISSQAYEYKRLSDDTYSLCANFETDNRNSEDQASYAYSDRWPHATGYQCLKQKALDFEKGGAEKAVPSNTIR